MVGVVTTVTPRTPIVATRVTNHVDDVELH